MAHLAGRRTHRLPNGHAVLNRRGVTLAELLVALTMGAIALGGATRSVARQHRFATDGSARTQSGEQSWAAMAAMAAELRNLAPQDLVASASSDTALQLRSSVAVGSLCALGGSRLALSRLDGSGPADVASPIRVGDSLWTFDSDGAWRGHRIEDVATGTGCGSAGAGAGYPIVTSTLTDSLTSGVVVRVTRPVRYAFYKASDGRWQLGYREWLETSAKFGVTQPLAGPFVMAAGARRTGFSYFDSAGQRLMMPAEDGIARVRVSVLAPQVGGVSQPLADSVDVALRRR